MSERPVQMINLYDLVGVQGIAVMFGRPVETVHIWRNRKILPDPLPYAVSAKNPMWLRQGLIEWGKETGREVVDPDAGLHDIEVTDETKEEGRGAA